MNQNIVSFRIIILCILTLLLCTTCNIESPFIDVIQEEIDSNSGGGSTFTVTFDSQGGSSVTPQTIVGGGKVTIPSVPIKAGSTFIDWYRELSYTNQWDFGNDTVTVDMILYARWTIYNSFVAVGDGGQVSHSDDGGLNWTTQTIGGGLYDLNGVTYGGGRLVVVGDEGKAWYSDDRGTNWTATLIGTSENFNEITWGNYLGGRFLAVGTNKTVAWSNDGGTGTWNITLLPTYTGVDVAFGADIFTVVWGSATFSYVDFSTNGGETWTQSAAIPTEGAWNWSYGITYGTRFVSVGTALSSSSEEAMFYSADGNTWAGERPTNSGQYVPQAVGYDGSNFYVSVGDSGRIWYSSNDGVTWSQPSGATPDADCYGIIYGGGTWIAVGDVAGSGNVWRSPDIDAWTAINVGTNTLNDAVHIP